MPEHDEDTIEDRMQSVHTVLKVVSASSPRSIPPELALCVRQAAAAILAGRRHITPDASDDLTVLLVELSQETGCKIVPFSSPTSRLSLSTFYRSGADIETNGGRRFDVWAVLANARIGLLAPQLNA